MCSPRSPAHMDWSPLYPAFVDTDFVSENEIAATPEASEVQRVPSLTKRVEIADVGCGFGGLLFALAPQFPHTLALGMLYIVFAASISIDCSVTCLSIQTSNLCSTGLEIRTSVAEFVQDKIKAMRAQSDAADCPGSYQNIACLRA